MEWFQETATEQHDRVNGYCNPKSPQDTADVRWTPPEGESGGSDSCGGTSVSELTDVQELKARESEDEEDKEEKEVVPASKGLKGDQAKKEKESPEEKNKQNSSAATSYTGKIFISNSRDSLDNWWALIFFSFFFCRPVTNIVTLAFRTAASWPRRQRGGWDQRGV